MSSRLPSLFGRTGRRTAIAATFLLAAGQAHAQGAGPFAPLQGSWTGGGTISLSSGANERIRCRASYDAGGGGRTLQLSIRCASDSYNFDLAGNVLYQGGAITGTWSESTRSVNGTVSGRASSGQIQALAQGASFSANLSIATRGGRQSVVIRPSGADVTQVAITLARR